MACKIKVKVLSARHLLTSRLVTFVIGLSDVGVYQFSAMRMAAGGHVGLRVFTLLLGKCRHTR